MTTNSKHTGLVVLDVDGVVFPGQFIIALARRKGWWTFACTVADCLMYNVGRMDVHRLLERAFLRLKGMPWADVCAVYRGMAITRRARWTIRALRAQGRRVILLTAGAPDALVRELAEQLHADAGAGMRVEVRDGRLTGRIGGELASPEGKLAYVERLIARDGLDWKDVTAVGDDRNNLPLMRRAGVSIGYHATYMVRREAQHLVEEDSLAPILPLALGMSPRLAAMTRLARRRPWFREIIRKSLHMTGLVALFLGERYPVGMSLLLLVAIGLYLGSEFWRLNGAYIPLVHRVHRMVMRRHEWRGMAIAPLTLALGVLVALWALPVQIALASILVVTVSDSAAAIIGSRWGRTLWPHNPLKTLEGSGAFLVTALVCAAVYLPVPQAVLLALVATAIESLPLQDWDNFLTPVGAGLILATFTA